MLLPEGTRILIQCVPIRRSPIDLVLTVLQEHDLERPSRIPDANRGRELPRRRHGCLRTHAHGKELNLSASIFCVFPVVL